MIEIFLSRPNWIPSEFEEGVNNFYSLLKSMNLSPRTIGQSDYPNESPLNEVLSLMKKCNGTIVLGIPQIIIRDGMVKNEQISYPIFLGTEWNHIETALAFSLGHPILILRDDRVNRGVFEKGATNSFLYDVDMENPSWCLTQQVSGALNSWKTKLNETKFVNVSKLDSPKLNKPRLEHGMYLFEGEFGYFCPVCYTKDKLKIPCTRLNSRFYQCPNCRAQLG